MRADEGASEIPVALQRQVISNWVCSFPIDACVRSCEGESMGLLVVSTENYRLFLKYAFFTH